MHHGQQLLRQEHVTVIAAVDLQPWFDKDKVRKANFEVPNDTITD